MIFAHSEIIWLWRADIIWLRDFVATPQAETLITFSSSPGKLVAIWTGHKSSTHFLPHR